MTRRARSALLCVLLLATHVLQGSIAAATPCADDFPGIMVVCAAGATQAAMASVECAGTAKHADHCPFCVAGGCGQTQVPALSPAITPLLETRLHCADSPEPIADSFRFTFDLILRPPK